MVGISAQRNGPAMDSARAVDWKSNMPPWVRPRIVDKLMKTIKMHEPTSVPEALNKLKKLALLFEEDTFMFATSQGDYLLKTKLNMRYVEIMAQNITRINPAIPNSGLVIQTTSNSVNMASQQVGSQTKNNPRKEFRWTENMDQVLVNGLLEIVLAGPKRTEKGFKAEEFTKVIDKVRETCHVSVCVANVRARLRTLKKKCDDITKLFKTSGFGLDSSGRVLADPITWETYIKEKPDGAKMKEKLCPRYYDLLTVFGNDVATGDRADSENDFPSMSESVDDLEGKNDVEETKSSHSINSYRSVQGSPPRRRKRTKLMEDVVVWPPRRRKRTKQMEDAVVAFAKQVVAFDKQASQNYVNGQAILEKLKEMDINQGDIMDLMEVFEKDEKAGKFFLEITDVEFLRLWVYRKLGQDLSRL